MRSKFALLSVISLVGSLCSTSIAYAYLEPEDVLYQQRYEFGAAPNSGSANSDGTQSPTQAASSSSAPSKRVRPPRKSLLGGTSSSTNPILLGTQDTPSNSNSTTIASLNGNLHSGAPLAPSGAPTVVSVIGGMLAIAWTLWRAKKLERS